MEEDTRAFNPDLFEQITRPQDCFLGIAIPLTLEAAQRQFAAPKEKHDFIRRYLSKPPDRAWWEAEGGYGDKVEKKIRPCLQELLGWGVEVKEEFSLINLSNIQHRFKVIAVLAHSPKTGTVELADGVHLVETFAAAIPHDYMGIFDLINCFSEKELQNAIKSTRPQCLTIANVEERDLDIALFVYKHLIKKLATEEMNYVDAHKELREMFSKRQDNFLNSLSNKIKNLFN